MAIKSDEKENKQFQNILKLYVSKMQNIQRTKSLQGKNLIAIYGQAGSGKSTIARYFLEHL